MIFGLCTPMNVNCFPSYIFPIILLLWWLWTFVYSRLAKLGLYYLGFRAIQISSWWKFPFIFEKINFEFYMHWILNRNYFTTLPLDMGETKNLKVLNLKHNRFVELPRILYTFTKIQVIGLHFVSSWSPHIRHISTLHIK